MRLLMEQNLLLSMAMTKHLISNACMLAQARPPPDDNRLTSNYAKFGLAQLHIL